MKPLYFRPTDSDYRMLNCSDCERKWGFWCSGCVTGQTRTQCASCQDPQDPEDFSCSCCNDKLHQRPITLEEEQKARSNLIREAQQRQAKREEAQNIEVKILTVAQAMIIRSQYYCKTCQELHDLKFKGIPGYCNIRYDLADLTQPPTLFLDSYCKTCQELNDLKFEGMPDYCNLRYNLNDPARPPPPPPPPCLPAPPPPEDTQEAESKESQTAEAGISGGGSYRALPEDTQEAESKDSQTAEAGISGGGAYRAPPEDTPGAESKDSQTAEAEISGGGSYRTLPEDTQETESEDSRTAKEEISKGESYTMSDDSKTGEARMSNEGLTPEKTDSEIEFTWSMKRQWENSPSTSEESPPISNRTWSPHRGYQPTRCTHPDYIRRTKEFECCETKGSPSDYNTGDDSDNLPAPPRIPLTDAEVTKSNDSETTIRTKTRNPINQEGIYNSEDPFKMTPYWFQPQGSKQLFQDYLLGSVTIGELIGYLAQQQQSGAPLPGTWWCRWCPPAQEEQVVNFFFNGFLLD